MHQEDGGRNVKKWQYIRWGEKMASMDGCAKSPKLGHVRMGPMTECRIVHVEVRYGWATSARRGLVTDEFSVEEAEVYLRTYGVCGACSLSPCVGGSLGVWGLEAEGGSQALYSRTVGMYTSRQAPAGYRGWASEIQSPRGWRLPSTKNSAKITHGSKDSKRVTR